MHFSAVNCEINSKGKMMSSKVETVFGIFIRHPKSSLIDGLIYGF